MKFWKRGLFGSQSPARSGVPIGTGQGRGALSYGRSYRHHSPAFAVICNSAVLLHTTICCKSNQKNDIFADPDPKTFLIMTTSYTYYNELYDSGQVLNRTDNGVCTIPQVADNRTNVEVDLFHVVGVHGFSQFKDYINTAGAIMGIHHFNTRNATVVAELGDISSCPIRMTYELHDTGREERTAVKKMADVLSRDDKLPCAISGASKSSVSIPVATFAGSFGLAQINWSSGTDDLSSRDLYPYFTRVIPASGAKAAAAVKYLSSIGVRHCVALYQNNAYGNAYLRAFKEVAQDAGLTVKIVVYSPNNPEEAIKAVKDTQFRYTFCCVVTNDFVPIMTEVYNQKLYGSGQVWFFGNTPPTSKVYARDSPVDVASKGAAFITMTTTHANNERFYHAWDSLSSEEIAQIDSMMPSNAMGTLVDHYRPSTEGPLWSEKQAYDATVSLGLAVCRLYTKTGGYDFKAEALYNEIVSNAFIGASGLVKIDSDTGSRSPQSVSPEIYFFDRIEQNSTHSTFDAILSVKMEANAAGTDWIMADVSRFRYFDGSLVAPQDLPPLNGGEGIDMQQIGNLRFLSYTLFAVVMVLVLVCLGWVHRYKGERVVKASQPLFLQLIAVGVAIMSASMITMSIDDEHFSQLGCDVACMLTPWFFNTGFAVCFSALFSKTWRINRILNEPSRFQRVKVDVKDVILPLIMFLVVNSVVLICWTALSPMKFVREYNLEVTDAFNRSFESSGSCQSRGSSGYIIALASINLSIVLFATVQAYKARNISTEYSESAYIALVMISLLQMGAVGIPVLLLARDDPKTFFIISCLVIFIISAVILGSIFSPKMRNQRIEKHEKINEQRERAERQRRAQEAGAHLSTINSINPQLQEEAPEPDEDVESSGLKFKVMRQPINGGLGTQTRRLTTPEGY